MRINNPPRFLKSCLSSSSYLKVLKTTKPLPKFQTSLETRRLFHRYHISRSIILPSSLTTPNSATSFQIFRFLNMASRNTSNRANAPGKHEDLTKDFSETGLKLICYSALYSMYAPDAVARLFQGGPNFLANVSDVTGPQICACFFQMLRENHVIYRELSHRAPNPANSSPNLRLMQRIRQPKDYRDRRDALRTNTDSAWKRPR